MAYPSSLQLLLRRNLDNIQVNPGKAFHTSSISKHWHITPDSAHCESVDNGPLHGPLDNGPMHEPIVHGLSLPMLQKRWNGGYNLT